MHRTFCRGLQNFQGRLCYIEEQLQKACCARCHSVASVEHGEALPANLPLRCQRAAKTAARHLHVDVLTCHGVHQNPGFCSQIARTLFTFGLNNASQTANHRPLRNPPATHPQQ